MWQKHQKPFHSFPTFNFLHQRRPMTSPAVVNFAPERGSVEIREIERPSIGPDDVLLEVGIKTYVIDIQRLQNSCKRR